VYITNWLHQNIRITNFAKRTFGVCADCTLKIGSTR